MQKILRTQQGQVIETNTSKNYRQRETEFKKIYQKMKYYCSSTGECKEENGVFVFKNENAFYTYHSLFSKIGQRDRVKLDYEEEKPTLGERAEKIASGVLDMGIGNLTASVGIGLIGASGIGQALSGGTLTPLAAVTAGAGITATGVGGNKVISGVSKIGDGLFGNKEQVTGNSFNPLRDATGALTGKPEYYDGFELVTEVGAAGRAPYIPMLSAINHSKLKALENQNTNEYIKNPNPIEENFNYTHILDGEINRNNASGGHTVTSGNVKVTSVIKSPDKNGVYKAKVEIYNPSDNTWKEKGPYTTMFPDDWSENRIREEIRGAWDSSDFTSKSTRRGLRWEGTSPSGVKIEGYIKNDGTTAYPMYQEGGK